MSDGGSFSWLLLSGTDTRWLTVEAVTEKVAGVPGAGFVGALVDHEPHPLLSFSRSADEEIDEGVTRLHTLIEHVPDPSLGTVQES